MRTILFSVFSIVEIGNFDIPGGVFDELMARKDENTKIVFLAPEGFRERLKPYTNKKGVSIECIEKILPKGIIQKTFHFFYSYLIFTGTTKILATFGARADRPPAGGNRHFAPVKALIANTFGEIKIVKTKLVPWLYQRIHRARPYKALFEKYNPNLVFAGNIAFLPDIELIAEAKRMGITTIGMACNWDHLNKYFIPLQADTILVQNNPMRKEAVDLHAYKQEQTIVVGFPQFDAYERFRNNPMSKEEFCKKFSIPPNKKLIVFVSGAAYALDEPDILHAILKWIRDDKFVEKVHLMIRPYVIARDKGREECKYHTFKENPIVSFNTLRRDESEETRQYYLAMLYHADVVIPIFSTVAIEAAIFNRPTVTIGFDGYRRRPFHQSIMRLEHLSHFKHVLETGSVQIARGFEDLLRKTNVYLEKPETDRAARKRLVEKMCYKVDGLSSARIADVVMGNER